MPLPTNITKDHLLSAIHKIDAEGIPKDGDSRYYDLVFGGKRYPPKVVVSYANLFANGAELSRDSFGGGEDQPSFKLLRENGFLVEKKTKSGSLPEENMTNVGFYEQLIAFLEQAKTGDLKTKHFLDAFLGTKVKVSFGQGGSAKIPWISFLLDPNKTSHGIYPVYLFYKQYEILILAYGISETKEPDKNWNGSESMKTIKEYFEETFFVKPDRYGESYIFKVYDVNKLPPANQIEDDLEIILGDYKLQTEVKPIEFLLSQFKNDLSHAGLVYTSRLITSFVASLLTKPFVILTGLSGSGKTKLAQAFVQWICQSRDQYRIVPVGADWTNREPLLGYPNALNPLEYVEPDSGVLEIIIQAVQNPGSPYFLILDEMNLSHVERYFADFLSAMESKESIPLHSREKINKGIPQQLPVPPNLFIIGTVNIDETTNMFSPKVLDRANTIEFRISELEMSEFLSNLRKVEINSLNANGASMAKSFLDIAAKKTFNQDDNEKIIKQLSSFFTELKKAGAEFGYRSASEILILIRQISVLDATLTTNEKIDIAVIQKLLPKLHGSRRKLCPVLETLGGLCVQGSLQPQKDIFSQENFDFSHVDVLFPLSLEKIARMYKGALDNGFASFAEA